MRKKACVCVSCVCVVCVRVHEERRPQRRDAAQRMCGGDTAGAALHTQKKPRIMESACVYGVCVCVCVCVCVHV